MHVGSSTAEAEKEARPALDRYNRTRLYTGVKSREYEFLHEQQLIAIGDAKAVAATIRRYQDAGFTTFLALMDFGGLEQKLVLRSMERYCKEVIPLLP
jgi:alkanesulfonate monooxygenase SsuD/methylene tetrahydromethanopterin reductase-like flavin-dependent oxidoreductase (luciferase family)